MSFLISFVSPTLPTELYEGLKIAQRGRLNDQRGTETNFEMPEFLKRKVRKAKSWDSEENS